MSSTKKTRTPKKSADRTPSEKFPRLPIPLSVVRSDLRGGVVADFYLRQLLKTKPPKGKAPTAQDLSECAYDKSLNEFLSGIDRADGPQTFMVHSERVYHALSVESVCRGFGPVAEIGIVLPVSQISACGPGTKMFRDFFMTRNILFFHEFLSSPRYDYMASKGGEGRDNLYEFLRALIFGNGPKLVFNVSGDAAKKLTKSYDEKDSSYESVFREMYGDPIYDLLHFNTQIIGG